MKDESRSAERGLQGFETVEEIVDVDPQSQPAAPSRSSDPLIGKKIGNYVIGQQLGVGGMGTVYLAEHPEIARKVAVKVLARRLCHDRELMRRFLDEARAASQIKNPNVIDIYDFGRTDRGQPYFIMELLEGHELADVIREAGGPMELEQVWRYLEPMCSALQAAHDRRIVHRDLKPENVFVLSEPPYLKILDFGLAKALEPGQQQRSKTATGMVMGTALTIAPEQAAGDGESIGPQTDVYSLGVILYWMLAGEPPFDDEHTFVLMAKHITDPPPPLRRSVPSIPVRIAELVASCLEKEPADRPASAAEVARRFEAALRDPKPEATRPEREAKADAPPAAASTAGPLKSRRSDTTMQSATGEVSQGADARPPSGGRKRLTLVAISAVTALAVALFVARIVSEPSVDEPSASASTPVTPIEAAGQPESAPPGHPPAAGPVHRLRVTADDQAVRCSLRLEGRPAQRARVPCSFELPAAKPATLELRRSGYKPLVRELQLAADRELHVETKPADRALAFRATTRDEGSSGPIAAKPKAEGRSGEEAEAPTKAKARAKAKAAAEARAEARAKAKAKAEARAKAKAEALAREQAKAAARARANKAAAKAQAKAKAKPAAKASGPKPKRKPALGEGTVAF